MAVSAIVEVITAIAQVGLAGAACVGVWVAYSQLSATRVSYISRRRSEVAEDAIVLLRQVEDSFRHMRNPFDSIPRDKLSDREFVYRRRYERVVEANDLFEKLRELQVRCDAIIPNADLKSATISLINSRSDIALAIEELSEIEGDDRNGEDYRRAHRTLYGSWSDRDSFGLSILQQINAAVHRLEPFARFE